MTEKVITKFNAEDPLRSEVAILGGAGTLSLDRVKLSVVKQLTTVLASLDNEVAHSTDWEIALRRLEIIQNKIETIVVANKQLKAYKSQGGRRSQNIPRDF